MRIGLLPAAAVLFLPLLLSCAAGRVSGARGVAGLDALFTGGEMLPDAHWGVRVETMDGEVLYDHNGAKGFSPASTLKIITTAAALDLLGPDYTFQTTLEMAGTIHDDGTLEGDLLITGSGDPSFGSWHLDPENEREAILTAWADAVHGAGIRAIDGRVIGDGRFFTAEYIHPGWNYGDLPRWYATGSSGLAIEENAWRCEMLPGDSVGDPVRLTMIPDTSYFTVINTATTAPAGERSTAGAVNYLVEGNTFLFTRQLAIDEGLRVERGAVWDGTRYAAHLFREELIRRGIAVSGDAVNIRQLANPPAIDEPDARTPLATHTSPPLARLCEVLNRESHNFFADQILRTLGRVESGEGSYGAGTAVVKAWMEAGGAPAMEAFSMRDGGGLAAANVIQPRHLTHVLRWGHQEDSPARAAFRRSLAAASESPWLRGRMAHLREGTVYTAKTGYIGFARTIAGTITNAQGEHLAFAILCNNHAASIDEVDGAVDATLIFLSHSTREDFRP